MKDSRFMLATAEEIRAIFRRATGVLDAIEEQEMRIDNDPDLEDERAGGGWRPAFEAIRFCCVAAGQLGDPSLLPIVAEALEISEHMDDYAEDHRSAIAGAITYLLDEGAPVDAHIKDFAAHADAEVREAVARGLKPEGAPAIALLEDLSTDPIPDVRNAAKRALSAVREVPWWRGKFARDPVLRLEEEEALRLKPALSGISTILDEPFYKVAQQEAQLFELARALPADLVIDMVETIHSAAAPYGTHLSSLVSLMLEQPGGVEAFKRLLPIWSADRKNPFRQDALPKMVQALSRETRASVCKELAAYAVSLSEDPAQVEIWAPAHLAATAVGKAWPPGEDLSPLLDLLLAVPPSHTNKTDWVANELREAFAAPGADPAPILSRALEARLADYPGRWKVLGSAIDTLLERAPGEAIRAAAERAIVSDSSTVVAWGLRRLVVQALDPARDGSREDLLRRFFAEPRYRSMLCSYGSLGEIALPVLREELRAGSLELDEATHVLGLIGTLYGGVALASSSGRTLDMSPYRQKKLDELDAFLGPEELRGPPTAEEWQRSREARARWNAGGIRACGQGSYVLGAFPSGAWIPEDREVLDAAVQAVRAGKQQDPDGELAIGVAMTLTAKPVPEAFDIFEDLLKHADPAEHALIKIYRRNLREAMGLPRKQRSGAAGSGKAAGDSGEGEWMDEPEDDDDDA